VRTIMKFGAVPICLGLLLIQNVSAQEKLAVNQPVSRTIAAGATDKFSISLNDGDYVDVSLSQHGRVNLAIIYPGGTVIRRLSGPQGDAKNTFAIGAEGTGIYWFNIGNPGEQAASYELLLPKLLSLNERFRPEVWSDPNPSPRIQALRNQITSGQTSTGC
jgi:hypothetical protein